MRKFLTILPLIALSTACSENNSLETKGREAGAAADQAIERASDQVAKEQDQLQKKAQNIRDRAGDVRQDVKEDMAKAEKAVDAAEAELKK